MADITLITSALTSIKTATDIVKLLKESNLSLERAETKLKLAELIDSLADAKIQISEFQEVLMERDKKIKELEETISLRENLFFDGAVYWRTLEDGEKEGPYCQRCYDADTKLIRLQTHYTTVSKGSKFPIWHCQSCDKSYNKMKSGN